MSPEKYANILLILFLSFFFESQLFKDGSYCDRLQELNVLETVKKNHKKFEPNSEIIDSVYMQIQKNANDSNIILFTETSSPGNEVTVVKNPVMILDSQIEGPKLGL